MLHANHAVMAQKRTHVLAVTPRDQHVHLHALMGKHWLSIPVVM